MRLCQKQEMKTKLTSSSPRTLLDVNTVKESVRRAKEEEKVAPSHPRRPRSSKVVEMKAVASREAIRARASPSRKGASALYQMEGEFAMDSMAATAVMRLTLEQNAPTDGTCVADSHAEASTASSLALRSD